MVYKHRDMGRGNSRTSDKDKENIDIDKGHRKQLSLLDNKLAEFLRQTGFGSFSKYIKFSVIKCLDSSWLNL